VVNETERGAQRRWEGLPLASPRVVYFLRHPHLGLAGLDRADQATGVFLLASRLPGRQSTTYFFDLQELFQFTDAQPMREGPDAGTFMAELRRDVRY